MSNTQYVVVRLKNGEPSRLGSFDLHEYEKARELADQYHAYDVENGPTPYWSGPPREYGVCRVELVKDEA